MLNLFLEKRILNSIFEGQRRRKYIIVFSKHCKLFSVFLHYLTINKVIYGFCVARLNLVHLFLKYPQYNQGQGLMTLKSFGLPRRYLSKFIHFKKSTLSQKNEIYIYKTIAGYLRLKDLITLRIGGRVFLQIL